MLATSKYTFERGIAAFIILGLSLLLGACSSGGGGGSTPPANNAPIASNVTITDNNAGDARVGDSLTGSYTYADTESDAEGASTFRWLRNGTTISGATTASYILVLADTDQSITFEVTPVAAAGLTTGNAVASSSLAVNVAVARYAFVANFADDSVSSYTVDAGTGRLSYIGKVAAGTAPNSATVNPLGQYAYVANQNSNDVSQYTISTDGSLTPMTAPTVATE